MATSYAQNLPDKLIINTEEILPYNFTSEAGDIFRSNVDIVKTLLTNADVNYEIKLYP